MAPTLGYWDIRGLCTPIRLLLEHANVEYEEKLYTWGPPPEFDKSSWLKEKFTLGLDFPNLPYYIDADLKLTQSLVIMRYLARKHKLAGDTEAERLRADLVSTQAYDFHIDYARVVYNPNFMALKDDYSKTVPDRLKLFVNFLGTRKFVAGDKLTYADFVLFEYLENQLYFNKDVLRDFPTLVEFHERILALESVDRYFKSARAVKFPFTASPSYFSGAYSEQNLASKK